MWKLAWPRLILLTGALGLVAACREPNAPGPTQVGSPATSSPGTPSPLAEVSTKPGAGELCNLEFIDGTPFSTEPAAPPLRFQLRGWLGDQSGSVPVASTIVFASADGGARFGIPIQLSVARPDVEAAFPGKGGLGQPGFAIDVDASTLPRGRYNLYLSYSFAGVERACDNGRKIDLQG